MKQLFFIICVIILSTTVLFSQSNKSENFVTDDYGKIYYSNIDSNDQSVFSNYKQLKSNPLYLTSIIWNNQDYDISENPTVDSWNPRIDVGLDGTIYVVYNDNHSGTGLQKIMFRKKVPAGDWTEPDYIDKGGDIGTRNNHFPALAVSPNGDIHAIYNVWAYENIRNYIGYSFYDASEDLWTDGVEISEAGGSVNHFNAHHDIYSTADNLPVVIWGFDNRENADYEEIYMKYFDGSIWSSDLIVSGSGDNLNATYPYITSIGNNKAMIIFGEETGNMNELELKYRIYDETTHTLTAIQTVPQTLYYYDQSYLRYDIAYKDNDNALIGIWQNATSSPYRDTIKVINYNITNDEFIMSDHKYINETTGSFPKLISIDCDAEGDCGIVYTDTYLDNCSFIEFDPTLGFSEVQVFNNEDVMSDEYPDSKFDADGNLHVVWADLRFDAPGGFVEREIFYEQGSNIDNTYSVTFNVTESDQTSPIEDAEVTFYSITQNTSSTGETIFEYILAGTYPWTVSKTGYDPETGEATVIDNNISVDVSLNETATYSVTFIVTESDGTTPIENASVTFNSDTQYTNADGEVIYNSIDAGTYSWTVTKADYETETGDITVSQDETIEISLNQILSVNELVNIGINIYPNPTAGIFNISLSGDITHSKVTVTDIIGKIIHQQFLIQPITTINLNVKTGIYLIRINSGNKFVISKINITK